MASKAQDCSAPPMHPGSHQPTIGIERCLQAISTLFSGLFTHDQNTALRRPPYQDRWQTRIVSSWPSRISSGATFLYACSVASHEIQHKEYQGRNQGNVNEGGSYMKY